MSLIKTNELNTLAAKMKELTLANKKYGDQFFRNDIQRMDFSENFPVATYDFGGFLNKNFNQSTLLEIKEQLDKTILYKAATTHFLSKPIDTFTGLTCYIPYAEDKNLEYYKHLQWYRVSGFYVLFER